MPHTRIRPILISLLMAAPCAGLGRLELNTEDVIVVPDQPVRFATALERKFTLVLSEDIPNALVDFYFDGRHVGRARTGKDGTAVAYALLKLDDPLNRRPTSYVARAYYKGKTLEARGHVYYWDPGKTVIAVDVDETISHTHYSDLFLADLDKYSKPLDGAAQTLWKLSRHYELLYVSARPRFLNNKTRKWLATHRFPPGPVANASKFEACFHQRRYKEDMLARLRRQFPNILVGIGDKKVDDEAYGANHMLSIIIDKPLFTRYGPHCFVFGDWNEVAAFFERQHTRLSDSQRLASLISESGMNLQQAFAAAPPPPAASPAPPPGALALEDERQSTVAKARSSSEVALP